MAKNTRWWWDDVPDEVWYTIFARLPDHPRSLEPVSLVCHRFLAITNHRRAALTLYSSPHSPSPAHFYARFPNLQSLHLCHPFPNLDELVRKLAVSHLPLRSLRLSHQPHFPRAAMRVLGESGVGKTLKTLVCAHLDRIEDDDLYVVADCFSYLHHLRLDGDGPSEITDAGVSAVSAHLASLVSFAIRLNETVSLEKFSSFASLTSLDLDYVSISASGLVQLSEAGLKLQKLVLRRAGVGQDVDRRMLCQFLKSCKFLCHIKLKHIALPKDLTALEFGASMPNVRVIHLYDVHIARSNLMDILKSCPNIEEVFLDHSCARFSPIGEFRYDGFPAHHRLRKLALFGSDLCNMSLLLLGRICPKLESFYLGNTPKVTEEGLKLFVASFRTVKICQRIANYSAWKKKEAKNFRLNE